MTTPIVSIVSIGARTGVAQRRLAAALAVAGAAVAVLAAVIVAHGASPREAAGRTVLELVVIGIPIAAGLYAVHGGHDVRFGATLVGAGFAWSLTALGESPDSLLYSIGRVGGWLVFPWLIYLTLAYPSGRVAGRVAGSLLVALNAVLVVMYLGSALLIRSYPTATPWASCAADCPSNAFMLPATEPAFMHGVQSARELLAVLLFAAAIAATARSWHDATPLRRQTLTPVMLVSTASVCLLAAFFVARQRSGASEATVTLGVLWSLCIPALGAAYFAGLLQRRLILGTVLERLGTLLGGQADVSRMRDAIAVALREPTLGLLVSDGPAGWRDSRGDATDLTAAARGRNVTMIRQNDGAEVALVHDGRLSADDDIVRAVGALALAGLRYDRMRTRLAASLAQLETSRRRIASAADQERARIERDLHDGAQQRLIALRVRLTLVEEQMRRDPEAGVQALVALGDEVDVTLDELRSLAHDVYPSMLRDRGLAQAVRGVAAQSPLPVRVQTIRLTQHSPDIDTALYFTCLEALQNVIKHAPTATRVRITLREADMLVLDVRDDGPGFHPRLAEEHGRGLRNMRDRIEAVGGSLTIESAPGSGTRIMAFVPLD
jgi:signal transduction histidine kinase